jgi:hypothetical protein
MALTPVSDPVLLSQLNKSTPPPAAAPSGSPVTDPAILAQLNGNAPDSPLKQALMSVPGALEEFLHLGSGLLASVPAGAAYAGAAVNKAAGGNADPDAVQAAVQKFLTYQPQSNSGQAANQAVSGAVSHVAQPLAALGDKAATAVGTVSPFAESLMRAVPGAAQAVSGLALGAGGVGAAAEGAQGLLTNTANPAGVAQTGAEVADAAGYRGLQSQQDLKLPNVQAISDTLGSADAGMPAGQALSPKTVSDRLGVVGQQYDAAGAALPTLPITGDAATAIQNAGGAERITKGTPAASTNIQSLKDQLLAGPVTGPQVVKELQALRQEGYSQLGSDDISQQLEGTARLQMADALDQHIDASLPPDSNIDLTQTREDYAKGSQLLASLKGGEHVDPMVYARIFAKNPNLLTGNAQILGRTAASLPSSAPFGANIGLVHGVNTALGAGAGAAAGHLLGAPELGSIAGGATGMATAPYVARALHNLFARGDVGAAGETANNPALSYFFKNGETPPGWNRSAPAQQPPLLLTHQPEPTVNAGGGAATNTILDQLGLTHDVQQAGAQHPGAPSAGVEPPANSQPPMGVVHPPLTQNWAGAGPDNVPNLSTTPGAGGAGAPDMRGLGEVLSSLVPDNIVQRTAAPGGAPMYEALNRTPDDLDAQLQALADKLGPADKSGGVANRGSNDSGVSPEFANVQDADRASGVQRSVINPDGIGMPVNGLAARDLGVTSNSGGASVPKGHIAIEERPGQAPTIINRGGLSPQTAKGLLNRFLSLRDAASARAASEPNLGDILGG